MSIATSLSCPRPYEIPITLILDPSGKHMGPVADTRSNKAERGTRLGHSQSRPS
jgi:hypothetical protein